MKEISIYWTDLFQLRNVYVGLGLLICGLNKTHEKSELKPYLGGLTNDCSKF